MQKSHFTDLIADIDVKLRDVPKSSATVFHITKYSHADFDEIMKEKIIIKKSAEQELLLELEKIK